MKIRFLPEGGFDKNGAFIEYEGDKPTGDEPEYQREGFISIDIVCNQLEIRTFADVANEYDEPDNPDRSVKKMIAGTGTIQPARWGRSTLSFLGKKKAHDKVSLSIRSNDIGEAVSFGGLYSEADLDGEGWHEFYVQIEVHTSRFNELVSELSEAGASLKVHIMPEKFEGFYATWSPSISDGRKIKFLDNKRDVENAEDIPDKFWPNIEERRKMLSDLDNAPVNIGVIRPLISSSTT